MKTLAELAEEVAHEQLQLAWDNHLVTAWYEYPKASMRRVVGSFFSDNLKGMTEEKRIEMFGKLKRVPYVYNHWRSCASRFIAGYLPRLNTVLWNDRLSRDEIITRLNASGIEATRIPDNAAQYKRDRAEQDKAVRDERAFSSLRRLRADARYESSRSNWKVCK